MGKAYMKYREIRFIIEDELTQVYVFIEAIGDSPLSVQGWHHKTFPASRVIVDIINEDLANSVMWGLEAPPGR